MKMNIRAWLFAPWILFFAIVIVGILVAGTHFQIDLRTNVYSLYLCIIISILCIYINFITVTKAGIWLSYSIPKSLRMFSWLWLFRLSIAISIALIFYRLGQISWVPLLWQGFVQPIVFSIALVFVMLNLISPVLIWCANVPFTRFIAVVVSASVLIFLPMSGVFIGEMILGAYEASLPKPLLYENKTQQANAVESTSQKIELNKKNVELPQTENLNGINANTQTSVKQNANANTNTNVNPKLNPNINTNSNSNMTINDSNILEAKSERAIKFKILAQKKSVCTDESVNVQRAIHEENQDDIVYWALQAMPCANLKSLVMLPKLVDIMLKDNNKVVRAAAIRAMTKLKKEDVRKIGYLLLKQINEKHEPIVIEAAASTYSKLGTDEYNTTIKKLKVLLNNSILHKNIAHIFINELNREDLVLDHINHVLNSSTEKIENKKTAIEMICVIPEKSLTQMEPQVQAIVKLINSNETNASVKEALNCLGATGVNAIRDEIKKPKVLNRTVAMRVLSEMNIKNSKEVLDTVSECVNDKDPDVKSLCIKSLGKVGAIALPKIVELMNAPSTDVKKTGEQALSYLDDPLVKDDLLKIRAAHSGWLTTQNKLGLLKSIDNTLGRIEDLQRQNIKASLKLEDEKPTLKKALNTKEESKTRLRR